MKHEDFHGTNSRDKNYNLVKQHIVKIRSQVKTESDLILPSIRTIAEMLNINKSSVARIILKLEKKDKWLVRMQSDSSPRNTLYKIIVTPDQIEGYQDYCNLLKAHLLEKQTLKLLQPQYSKTEISNKKQTRSIYTGALLIKPSETKFYIYRFLNESDEIIYIGKTNNIKRRMQTHFSRHGHLPAECYKSIKTIEYIAMGSKAEMDIREIYYINKINPFYNTVDKRCDVFNIELPELDWKNLNYKT